jgi:YidC/Oxa1 family membrane protein insertase
MDADVVVTTLGDLDNYYIKRSYIRKDIEYVYMFHHCTSMIATSTKGEYEHYDTLLCTGPFQIPEIRAVEEHYGTKRKNLVEAGYDLIDSEIAAYEKLVAEGKAHNEKPVILIGPSWQEDNLLDSCIDDILKSVLGKGWFVIVRPHPEYLKRWRPKWEALLARYEDVPADELYFEKDFSSNETIWTSDILITDWSSVSFEFAFSTLKPCVFFNTKMKENNPEWREFDIEQMDVVLRNRIGRALEPSEAVNVHETIQGMLDDREGWEKRIAEIREGFLFNVGHGGEAAGKYLLGSVLEKQEAKEASVHEG